MTEYPHHRIVIADSSGDVSMQNLREATMVLVREVKGKTTSYRCIKSRDSRTDEVAVKFIPPKPNVTPMVGAT